VSAALEAPAKHTATGWWLEEAGPVEERPPLTGDHEADVVVVGGGYTGLWTAWHVLASEPAARVVVVEADVCGQGPSGRNGGFCESLWIRLPALRRRFGDEGARAIAEASSESVDAIGAWCREQEVDAWFNQAGYVFASTAPEHDGFADGVVEAAAAVGAPDRVQLLDEAGVRARCRSPLFRRGALVPGDATVQPARLALGLRNRVMAAGAALHERSRVRRLSSLGSDRVLLETDAGSVRARAAVLAIGAAARGVRPLSSRLAVTSSHMLITEPVPGVLEEIGWTGGEAVTDGRTFVHYFRTTPDGRIGFGWGGGRPAYGARLAGNVEVDRAVVADVHDDLLRLFPPLRGRRVTHAWGGPIDVSPTHLMQIGSLPDEPVHFAFGFTGNGVGPSHLAGRALAALALDLDDDVRRLPIVGAGPGAIVPPEPLAYLGGSLVRRAMLRRDHAEMNGGRPGLATRAVAAAPRALGMHLGR
jgi:glycine/D-amino acid oxidase-like deaminating enzyme